MPGLVAARGYRGEPGGEPRLFLAVRAVAVVAVCEPFPWGVVMLTKVMIAAHCGVRWRYTDIPLLQW